MSKFSILARKAIKREGLEDLLSWLESTDFYKAPASSFFHGNYAGGLIDHSTHVYEQLKRIASIYSAGMYTEETLAIVALFHDLCKVNTYVESTRNVKNEITGVWEKKPFYKKRESFAFGGHGSKSVFLVMRFMMLTEEEASAINAHMGFSDRQDYGFPGEVFQQNKLAWMLHVADEAATYYDDERK